MRGTAVLETEVRAATSGCILDAECPEPVEPAALPRHHVRARAPLTFVNVPSHDAHFDSAPARRAAHCLRERRHRVIPIATWRRSEAYRISADSKQRMKTFVFPTVRRARLLWADRAFAWLERYWRERGVAWRGVAWRDGQRIAGPLGISTSTAAAG